MVDKSNKVKFFFLHIFFILIYFLFLLVEDNLFFFFPISFIFFFIIYKAYSNTFKSKDEIFVILLIFSIPLSFLNIFGMLYGSFPLSWFNIFLLSFILSIFVKKGASSIALSGLSLISIVYGLYLCSLILLSFDKIDAIQQLINLLMFIIVIIFVNNKNFSINSKDSLKIFCNVTFYISIAVIFQFVYFHYSGIIIGNIMFFSTRVAIGYLLSDFSFLSVYLASGLMIMILTNKRFYLNYQFYILFLACAITSARTGIVAFIIIYVVYIIVGSIKQLNRNPFRYFFSLLMTPAIFLFLLFL